MVDLDLQNKIIIASMERKSEFVNFRKNNPKVNFQLLNKTQLLNKLNFTFDDRANIYLHRKGILYENTEEILNSMLFLQRGITSKIDALCDLKEELDQNNLLKYNKFFVNYLKNKQIVVVGYDENDKELTYLQKKYHLDFTFITDEFKISHKVIEFEELDDEIRFIFERVGELLKSGVESSRIKIVAANEPYLSALKKYGAYYHIPFNFPSEFTYDKSEDFRLIKDYLKVSIAMEVFTHLADRVHYQDAFHQLFEHYIRVHSYLLENEVQEYLTFIAKKMKLPSEQYENGISICDLKDCNDDDYVIIPGFCLGTYPRICKDIDYLSDEEKNSLSRSNSLELQNDEERQILYFLSKGNNVTLSYSKKNDKTVYYLSRLAFKYNLEVVKHHFSNVIYSQKHFAMIMAKAFDDYDNFSYEVDYLYSCLRENISYLSYSHKFTFFDGFIPPAHLKLSFTSLQSFCDCPFKYYLSYFMNADEFETTLSMKIGNAIHAILEKNVKNIYTTIDEEIMKQEPSPSEEMIMKALIPQIEVLLETFNNWKEKSTWENFDAESENYVLPLNNNASLSGKIDLIARNKKEYVIIDYKTSTFAFDPSLVDLGFSLQLPLYYLLTSASTSKLKNMDLTGLYIFNVISKKFYQGDLSYLKFKGITLKEEGFDLMNDQYVSKNKELIFSSEYFEKLKNRVQEIANDAIYKIRKGTFIIQPKMINGKNHSCEFCPFFDICYHDYHDNLYLIKEKK